MHLAQVRGIFYLFIYRRKRHMLNFNDLKTIITRCCFVDKNTKKFADKFQFTLDCKRLETELQKRNSNLHVMSFFKKLYSEEILLTDLQTIIDYVHRDRDMDAIVDDHDCMMVKFIIYYADSKFVAPAEEGQKEIEWDEIFNILNDEDNPTEEADDIARMVTKDFPVYTVFMTRVFNNLKDKFEYRIFFRSNHHMLDLIKAEKEAEEEPANVEAAN